MGFFDFVSDIFGGDAPSTPTGFGSLPKFGQDALRDVITRGQDISNQRAPFSTPGYTKEQMNAINLLQRFNPVSGGPGFNFGQRASKAFDSSTALTPVVTDYISRAVNPISSGEISSRIGDFINPYVEEALAPTLRALREQRDLQLNDISRQASLRGAFGGEGQGVLESEAAKNYLATVGDVLGSGYADAFSRAAPLASSMLESGRNRYLSGAQAGLGAQNALTSLGTNLMGARLGMENLREIGRNRQRQGALDAIYAGDLLRGREQAQAQIPRQQVNYLASLINAIPAGGGQPTSSGFKETVGGLSTAAALLA